MHTILTSSLLTLALGATVARGADTPLSPDEIRSRLEITGEVFVVADLVRSLPHRLPIAP